tara:strand:- start:177 stop:608 length:432 start_codon:yes stop_codon:yes gene_type:complete
MKKLIFVLSIIPRLVFGQLEHRTFTELNIGWAAVDGYDLTNGYPGASFLAGQTYANNSLVVEYQLGFAFPTIGTGKLAIGLGNLDKNVMVACRPWPLFLGPQFKYNIFTASFEIGFGNEASFEAGLIATLGFRWQFKMKNRRN